MTYEIPLGGAFIWISALPGLYSIDPIFEWDEGFGQVLDDYAPVYGSTFEKVESFALGGMATFEFRLIGKIYASLGVSHFDLLEETKGNKLVIKNARVNSTFNQSTSQVTSIEIVDEERVDFVPLYFNAGIVIKID